MADRKEDLASIGEHCHVAHCNRLDFLPIKCSKCSSAFCKDHSGLTAHNCPGLSHTPDVSAAAFAAKVNAFTCRLDDCRAKEIVEFVCEFCRLNFCKTHRLARKFLSACFESS